uniref:RING-type E3 ubiquitin transferase n=1 Tax=Oryza brachyantha TaxID=4533 RepID=J3MGR3_ORYBR
MVIVLAVALWVVARLAWRAWSARRAGLKRRERCLGSVTASQFSSPAEEEAEAAPGGGEEDPAGCRICLEAYELGEALGTLPCGHSFHRVCAAKWFKRLDSCPLCRAAVQPA